MLHLLIHFSFGDSAVNPETYSCKCASLFHFYASNPLNVHSLNMHLTRLQIEHGASLLIMDPVKA